MWGERDFLASVSIRSFSSVLYAITNGFAHLQFEQVPLAKPNPQQVPRIAHETQEEANFIVDSLWGRTTRQSLILIRGDDRFVAVDEHPAPDYAADVSDRIGSEGCRLGVPQLVGNEVFIGQIADRPNAFLTCVSDVVEALFKLAFTILFCSFSESLGRALC